MIKGTNTPTRDPRPGTYICDRCGIIRVYKTGRPRPEMCRDCHVVERDINRDDDAIIAAIRAGATIASQARQHGITRAIVLRILNRADQ